MENFFRLNAMYERKERSGMLLRKLLKFSTLLMFVSIMLD